MRVILLKDVKKLGRAGEVIEIHNGYARNFLFPRGLAKLADSAALAELERHKAGAAKQEKSARLLAEKLANALAGRRFEFTTPANEQGHLYAALKETEILATIKGGGVELPERAKIVNYKPIKQTGAHQIKIDLGGHLADITIDVKTS